MEKIRVAVNGYGVIGKRVADAVRKQQDMGLIGVADVVTDYRIKTATRLGIGVYAAVSEKVQNMRNAGIPVEGTLRELLSRVEVVADCTPKKVGAADRLRSHGRRYGGTEQYGGTHVGSWAAPRGSLGSGPLGRRADGRGE